MKKTLLFLIFITNFKSQSANFIIPINVMQDNVEIWVNDEFKGEGSIVLTFKVAKKLKIKIVKNGYITEIIEMLYCRREKTKWFKKRKKYTGILPYHRGQNDAIIIDLKKDYSYNSVSDELLSIQTNLDNKYSMVRSSNSAFQIAHIGITDSLTHLFFKYTSNGNHNNDICIDDNIYIKANGSNKRYKLINSLNIPICPAVQSISEKDSIHYFSLTFEAIPKETTKIDIIENINNIDAINFNGVTIKPNYNDTLQFISLLESTPVKEKGSFYKDGNIVKYYVHKGFTIALSLQKDNLYGRYYTAYISIENHSEYRRDFNPNKISAKFNEDNNMFRSFLSYDTYMQIVKKKQRTKSFFYALGESVGALNSGYSKSVNTSDAYGNTNSISYFGNANGYLTSNVRTYTNIKTSSVSYNYDATANYFARQNAKQNIAEYNKMQYEIRKNINQEYLKINTVFSNERINGYVKIPYTKQEKNSKISVKIPFNNSSYIFEF